MVGEVTSFEDSISSGQEYDCIDIKCEDGTSCVISEIEIKAIDVLEDDGTFERLFGKVT